MATRFGYDKAIGLTGPLSVDWSEVTGETVKYLNQLQEKKDTTRKELATESRELAQQLAKNPYDYTSKYYGFWGKSSNQIMDLMSSLNDNFQSGDISKTDRDIKSANLQGQVEQYIAASQKFSQQEKERAQNSGPNGTYGAEDIFENEILSTALNYENIEPLFDPDSHTFNVLATGSDGVKRIMSGNEVFSSVERPVIGRFDMNKNIKEAFQRINVKTITKADGSVVAGDFVTKQGEEADNALRNLAQTMIQQPVQLRSMLSSYPISIEEDGEVKNYEFDRKFLPNEAYDIGGKVNMDVVNKLHKANPTIFYRDIQGNYYQSDKAKEIGEKYAMEQLSLAAEYTEKEAKPAKVISQEPTVDQLLSTVRAITGTGAKPPSALIELVLGEAGLSQEEIDKFKTDYNAEGTSDTSQIIDDAYSWLQSNLRDKSFGENIDKTIEGIQPVLFAFGYDVVKNDDGSIDVLEGEDVIYNIKEDDKNAFINLYNKIAGLQKRTGIALAYSSAKLADPSISKKKLPGQE